MRDGDGPCRGEAEHTPGAGPDHKSALLAALLGAERAPESGPGTLREDTVEAWSATRGALTPGRAATLAPSCLIAPRAGDTVLAWARSEGPAQVLAVLARADPHAPTEIACGTHLVLEAATLALRADTVTVAAHKMVTRAHAHHVVEDTRTEAVRLRVADVEEDVRRARNARDEVTGTLLQRAGAWFSNVAREIRVHARATLFD